MSLIVHALMPAHFHFRGRPAQRDLWLLTQVSTSRAQQICRKHSLLAFECSATPRFDPCAAAQGSANGLCAVTCDEASPQRAAIDAEECPAGKEQREQR